MVYSVSLLVTMLWFLYNIHFPTEVMAFDMVESLNHVLPHLDIDTV